MRDTSRMTEQTLIIDALGSKGDGIAELDDARVHVPFALPGEHVRVTGPADSLKLTAIEVSSDDRQDAACRHFGICGGCTLQHLKPAPYQDFKRQLVANALTSRGLEQVEIAPCLHEPAGGRRRATFAAARRGKAIVLGFHKRKSHDLVDLTECPVSTSRITNVLPALRQLADMILKAPKDELSFLLTDASNGLDLHIPKLPRKFSERDAMQVTAFALELGFIRISLKGFDTLTREQPWLAAGTARLLPPPGGFLQATTPGETHMAALVLDHIKGAGKVAVLFSGAGTFALRIAEHASVHAVEGDGPAIAALEMSARASQGTIHPVTTEHRDLFRRPLLTGELNRYDAIVLDPPRAGATAQVEQLAASSVARIAYVSCNPGTLSRDLAVLSAGGYSVRRVTPVDQFVWSAHVEAVAELTRD
ncbi:MAG: RNA methyltransferase [Hirschia sp.]|nr:RNA methyltransferase [Hirschia sp.]